MAIHDLKSQIARLPEQPGVYLFSNAAGDVLYVGKARVLRDRVRSYLGAQGVSPRIDALLRDAASLDVIVTDSVVEALALENRLIKQRNPRFNILLRDDKTYPVPPTDDDRARRRGCWWPGGSSATATSTPGRSCRRAVARRTMSLAHRLFGIRSCNEIIDGRRDRPCLEYDIKRCLAPCVEAICSIEQYGRAVEQARMLIEGRQYELVDDLRDEMADRRRRRALRAGGASARRDPDDRNAPRSPPAHGDAVARRPRRHRHEGRRRRDRSSRCFRCAAAASSIVMNCSPSDRRRARRRRRRCRRRRSRRVRGGWRC